MSRTSRITALYERLSRDDDLMGESNSNGKKARSYRAIKGCGYDEMGRTYE